MNNPGDKGSPCLSPLEETNQDGIVLTGDDLWDLMHRVLWSSPNLFHITNHVEVSSHNPRNVVIRFKIQKILPQDTSLLSIAFCIYCSKKFQLLGELVLPDLLLPEGLVLPVGLFWGAFQYGVDIPGDLLWLHLGD